MNVCKLVRAEAFKYLARHATIDLTVNELTTEADEKYEGGNDPATVGKNGAGLVKQAQACIDHHDLKFDFLGSIRHAVAKLTRYAHRTTCAGTTLLSGCSQLETLFIDLKTVEQYDSTPWHMYEPSRGPPHRIPGTTWRRPLLRAHTVIPASLLVPRVKSIAVRCRYEGPDTHQRISYDDITWIRQLETKVREAGISCAVTSEVVNAPGGEQQVRKAPRQTLWEDAGYPSWNSYR